MQTPTQRQAKRTASPDGKLPRLAFLNNFSYEDFRCWLHWWLMEQAQVEAMRLLVKSAFPRSKSLATQEALHSSQHLLQERANATLKILVVRGGLLCAWAGTTALQPQGGAA